MAKRTILDAVEAVLRDADGPQSVGDIHAQIVGRDLYAFKAKDALGVIRGTIRKHLRSKDESGRTRIVAVDRDRFSLGEGRRS